MSSRGTLRRAVVVGLVGLLAFGMSPGGVDEALAAPAPGKKLTPSQELSLHAGLQVAPKGQARARRSGGPVQPDPGRATLPTLLKADYSAWLNRGSGRAEERMASADRKAARKGRTGEAGSGVLKRSEREPDALPGTNDVRSRAELLAGFGTRRGDKAVVDVTGRIAAEKVTVTSLKTPAEDDGQLDRATQTGIRGIGSAQADAVLGDGPHGPEGDGSNDYDFYRLEAGAGERITVKTTATEVDTVVALYDGTGTLLGVNDEAGPGSLDSLLTYVTPKSGTYYALVAGFAPSGSLPVDPRYSGSGPGSASIGPYRLDVSAVRFDTDFYRLDLAAGDVIGATTRGATALQVYRPDGLGMVSSSVADLSAEYPEESPLPGGGEANLAYVAEKAGAYALQVDGPAGEYRVHLEAYRPGTEGRTTTRRQTILLDFDGETVDTTPFGGPSERTLSPLRDFMPAWGLRRSQEKELVRRVTAGVEENLERDLARRGLNDRFSVAVTSKAAGADRWGRKDVSRVVIGGTIQEAGIETIGISSSIDPGNYSHEDEALVLLDTLSSTDPDNEGSLNHYMTRRSNRLEFVARALANVASHEAGHYIGNFHTDGQNATHNLMDEGGSNFGANLYGVGRDGVGGTSDDEDIDFKTDAYSRLEGLAGQENTLNVSAWAFVRPRG